MLQIKKFETIEISVEVEVGNLSDEEIIEKGVAEISKFKFPKGEWEVIRKPDFGIVVNGKTVVSITVRKSLQN